VQNVHTKVNSNIIICSGQSCIKYIKYTQHNNLHPTTQHAELILLWKEDSWTQIIVYSTLGSTLYLYQGNVILFTTYDVCVYTMIMATCTIRNMLTLL